MHTDISESVLTEKVETFASALSNLDGFWKLANILLTIAAGISAAGVVAPRRNEIIFYPFLILILIIFYKLMDIIRIFSLGIGWVLLSINKNLEN